MTENPTCVGSHDTLATARALMRDRHVRHLPVVDEGSPVGLVSMGDLDAIERYRDVDPLSVEIHEAMAPLPFQVAPDTPLDEVVAAMAANRYGSALVVEEGRVVGIFTGVDALRATIQLCAALSRRRPHQKKQPAARAKGR
jgi:acetoin utilization protein AcuB